MDLGFLTMPKPLQRPHPPFVVTAVASFSQGVTEAARRYATDPDSPYRFCYNQLLSFRGETGGQYSGTTRRGDAMSRVRAGAATLNAEVEGPDDGPWLVLSNSLGANLDMWAPQMRLLTRKYRVLRYDTRGHGQSDAPAGAYSFDRLIGDVLGLMDAKSIHKASFMGLSMGGITGLGLALDQAHRFDRIICADARADAPDAYRAMWDERIAKVESGGLEAVVDGTLASWMTEDWHADNPDASADIRRMVLGNDPQGYINCCLGLKELDYLCRLGEVRIPVLYVGGDKDLGAAPAVMQAMADATPGAEYVQVANAAHVANINRPDAFNAAIAGFLGL